MTDKPCIARDGSPKKLTVPEIKPGMKRQTTGEPSPYHHGISVDDEPNTTKTYLATPGKPAVPVHSGMTDRQKAGVDPDAASKALGDAANLGRRT
jgi:hypothetical protein